MHALVLKSILQAMNFRDIVAISTFYLPSLLPAFPSPFFSRGLHCGCCACIADGLYWRQTFLLGPGHAHKIANIFAMLTITSKVHEGGDRAGMRGRGNGEWVQMCPQSASCNASNLVSFGAVAQRLNSSSGNRRVCPGRTRSSKERGMERGKRREVNCNSSA